MANHDGGADTAGPSDTSPEGLLAWLGAEDRASRARATVAAWRAAATRVRTLRGMPAATRPASTHECDAQTCTPQNELVYGPAAARLRGPAVAPEPDVYVCAEGAVHVCRGDRFRPEGAPEVVPCRLRLHHGHTTCLVTGRAHGSSSAGRGVTHATLGRKRKRNARAGAMHGETNGDERPDRRRRAGSAATDPLVFGDGAAILAEVAHPATLARQRAAEQAAERAAATQPVTKRTRALAAALASGTHEPHRMAPTTRAQPTPLARVPQQPPVSPRRRRGRGRHARGRAPPTAAARAAAELRVRQLERRPRRAECRDLLQRVLYHPQRMQAHASATRDAFTRATKAHQELMEDARIARATGSVPPTQFEAAVAFIRAVRPVLFEQRPADQPNNEVLAHLETLLLLHWEILLSSPVIRASPSRANFALHCLTLLDYMRGPGYVWRGHLVVPPVDYVARYMPRDLDHLDFRKRQFTEGMRTLREAYDAIPDGGMPLARLQRCIAGDETRFAGTEWRAR